MDILQQYAHGFFVIGSVLNGVAVGQVVAIEARGPGYAREVVDGEIIRTIKRRCLELQPWCETCGLDLTLESLRRIIELPSDGFRRQDVVHFLGELHRRMEDELRKEWFLYIHKEKSVSFDSDRFLGPEVFDCFPSLRSELREAGSAYAVGLNTACVFHLMRVVQIGANALARQMKAKQYFTVITTVNGRKVQKRKPMELCEWKVLIDGMTKALRRMEQGSSSSVAKKKTLAYYAEAVQTFALFKDAWRNNVSHANDLESGQRLYQAGETEDIVKNVRHFMRHLAKRIKE